MALVSAQGAGTRKAIMSQVLAPQLLGLVYFGVINAKLLALCDIPERNNGS